MGLVICDGKNIIIKKGKYYDFLCDLYPRKVMIASNDFLESIEDRINKILIDCKSANYEPAFIADAKYGLLGRRLNKKDILSDYGLDESEYKICLRSIGTPLIRCLKPEYVLKSNDYLTYEYSIYYDSLYNNWDYAFKKGLEDLLFDNLTTNRIMFNNIISKNGIKNGIKTTINYNQCDDKSEDNIDSLEISFSLDNKEYNYCFSYDKANHYLFKICEVLKDYFSEKVEGTELYNANIFNIPVNAELGLYLAMNGWVRISDIIKDSDCILQQLNNLNNEKLYEYMKSFLGYISWEKEIYKSNDTKKCYLNLKRMDIKYLKENNITDLKELKKHIDVSGDLEMMYNYFIK